MYYARCSRTFLSCLNLFVARDSMTPYETIYWKSEDGTNRFWLLESTSSADTDKQRAAEVGNVSTKITWEDIRARLYRRTEADLGFPERYPTPPFIQVGVDAIVEWILY